MITMHCPSKENPVSTRLPAKGTLLACLSAYSTREGSLGGDKPSHAVTRPDNYNVTTVFSTPPYGSAETTGVILI